MSKLQVDQITGRNGTGNITIPSGSKLMGTDIGSIVSTDNIVQIQYTTDMPTSHLSVTSTSDTILGMTCSITPVFSNSVIKVEYFSTMQLGSSNVIVLTLQRQIGSGSWVDMTPISNTSARYQYGWQYNSSSWCATNNIYFDSPSTTDIVTYRLLYRNWSSTSTNYLVHQYMEHGWILTEIKQ